jgi:hypothetical protein
MNPTDEGQRRAEGEGQGAEERPAERHWTPPTRSDQPPGEETVQVNDPYVGGDPLPTEEEPSQSEEQHPTGG